MEYMTVMNRVIRGAKGGKSVKKAVSGAIEAQTSLQSKATLRFIDLISEGECQGLIDGAKSVFFDDTPLQNADGSFNFTGVTFTTRVGTPDQAHMEGFPNVEAEIPVGVKVTTTAPVVRTITDASIDAVRVTIGLTGLSSQDTTNGNLNGTSVSFKIEYRPSGGSYITAVTPEQGTISGKTTSSYERQYRFDLTGNAPWDIRVTRLTPDNTVASVQNDVYFAAYTKIIDHKLTYPDWAYVGFSIDSSLFGNAVPTRTYDWGGIIVKVPSNYDATTRTYTGVWDGTFKRSWTNNPAWVLYDLLTHKRYGIGNYINTDEIDKFALYTIAQYCDELVDDGNGGLEPRFTFNAVIRAQDDALKVLQLIASNFRGMLYWGSEGSSGVITVVQDAPQDAVKIFTPANVIDGLFTYSSAAVESQHSLAYVTWSDMADGGRPATEVVENPVPTDPRAFRALDTVAYGATSRGQAHRFGKWALDTEVSEGEVVVYAVGLADADLRPGHIVKIQDPAYADIRFGGRLIAATASQLTLDAPIVLEAGKAYTIDVALPDGTLATAAIADGPGEYTVINLSAPLAQMPDPMAVWAVTSTDLAPRSFRVVTIKERSPAVYEVTALLYDPTKFARVEQGLNLPTSSFTRLSTGPLLPPTHITVREFFVDNGVAIQPTAAISWMASRDGRVTHYVLKAKSPGSGGDFELVAFTSGLSHNISNTAQGVWSFRVWAVDALGNKSPNYAELTDVALDVANAVPDDVVSLQLSSLGSTSVLSWPQVSSPNVSHYEVRHSTATTGATWNTSIVVAVKVAKTNTSTSVPSCAGTFFVKAVTFPTQSNPQGVYSRTAASIVTNVSALAEFELITTLIGEPAFAGDKVNTAVVGGNLELTEATPNVFNAVGTCTFSSVVDFGAVYTFRVTQDLLAAGNLVTNNVDLWADVDSIPDVDGALDGQWAISLEIRTTLDDTTNNVDMWANVDAIPDVDTGAAVTWSPWTQISIGDVVARAVQARITLYSFAPNVTPSIERARLMFHMPLFTQTATNITVDSGVATRIDFPVIFRSVRPAILVTPHDAVGNDYFLITDVDAAGFTITCYPSGKPTHTFDYSARGFGFISA